VHELSIAEELLRLCGERLQPGQRLHAVRIAVGELASVEPELLQFAWQGLTLGTAHDGATLTIDWRPARQLCTACGEVAERQPGSWLRLCPHCQQALSIAGGSELDLLAIDAPPAVRTEVSP